MRLREVGDMSSKKMMGAALLTLLLALLIVSPMMTQRPVQSVAAHHRTSFALAELTINHPPDMTFENGTRGKRIVWNATDPDPKNYTVTRDGEVFSSGQWFGEPIIVDLDSLYEQNLTYSLPRTFTFVCTVFNMQNQSVSDEVLVTVIPDEAAPIIAQPENISYEEGSFGHYIRWNITESNPDFYNISRVTDDPQSTNGTIEYGDWDGSNISLNVDNGNATHWYLYTLFLNDTLGHNSTSVVNVTVYEDLTPPTVSSPDDIAYEYGAKGNRIVWHVYDSNPKNYTIIITYTFINKTYGYLDESQVPLQNITQPNWVIVHPTGDDLIIEIDNLYVGNYTYNITLFDIYGRNATDAVNVTVYYDLRAPVVTAPADYSYEEGYTGHWVNWTIDENNPKSYNLTLDGDLLEGGEWNGTGFNVSADGLSVGDHVFNLTLTDYFNQTTVSAVVVTVDPDSHLPIVSNIQALQSFRSATENNVTIQASAWDLNGIRLMQVEWRVGNDTGTETKNMTKTDWGLYVAEIGAFQVGTVLYYRILATDNSSVNNVNTTEWIRLEITPLATRPTPALVWVPVLVVGVLSFLVVTYLYVKTRTR